MDNFQHTLKRANLLKKKKPYQIIDMISNALLEKDDLTIPYRELLDKPSNFLGFLREVTMRKCDPMENVKYVKALFEMFNRRDKWIRDISTWKRRSYNIDKQIKNISRHLFCKYNVPDFMDMCWYINNKTFNNTWVDWFIHIGQGGNIRTANIPVELTKKMAHQFLLAPDVYTPNEALRWAQVHGLGGDERLVRGIVESKIGNSFKNDDFWVTVIHFFVRNTMIDVAQVSPLIDYITHLKYDSERVFNNGMFQFVGPPKPNFEIRGRTVDSLIRGMEKWHKEVGKGERKGKPQKWEGFNMSDFTFKTGKDKNLKIFRFNQLLSAKELRLEGSSHGHCVASYSQSCSVGRTSIWSLSIEDFVGQTKPLLTIELNRDRVISQIRGKGNRRATGYEMSVIQKWIDAENLNIGRWV